MNGLTIQPNGQTLVVTSGPANFYSDTGLSSAVTYPVTVTTDTPWYCSAAVAVAVPDVSLTITQPDGSTIYSGSIRVGQTSDTFVRPAPGPYQVAEDLSPARFLDDAQGLTYYDVIPRQLCNVSNMSLTSGRLFSSHFTAGKAMTVASMTVAVAGTAAAATPTLVRMGLYEVSAAGNMTLVASTANDTTLMASTNAFSTKALSASYALKKGQRYAAAVLVVSAAAVPTLVSQNVSNVVALINSLPQLLGSYSGQTDLPSTVTQANVNGAGSATAAWFGLA